jgi:hypothetical protein
MSETAQITRPGQPATKPQPRSFGELQESRRPPRPKAPLPTPFPRAARPWTEAPSVMVMPNFTGSLADTVYAWERQPTPVNAYLAIRAAHRLTWRGERKVEIIGQLDEQGQRCNAAFDHVFETIGPKWTDADVPGYFEA